MSDLPVLNTEMLRDLILWARESEAEREYDEEYEDERNRELQVNGYRDAYDQPLVRYWDQSNWSCGTGCCIAGAAVLAAGGTRAGSGQAQYRGQVVDWSVAGAEILGLTYAEADLLFDGDNSLEKIETLAREFAAGRGVTIDI